MVTTTTEQQQSIGREVWRLHQLSAEAEMMYEMTGGECTAEATALGDWVAGCSDDTLHALAQFRAELEGRGAAIKQEADRLAEVKRRNEAKLEWVKARTLEVMQHLGKKSAEVGTFTITVVPGQERAEETGTVDIDMLELVDTAFVRVSEPRREPHKAAILKALKAGRDVPGYTKVRGSDSIRWK